MVTHQGIRKYVRASNRPVDLSRWTDYHDIPSTEEVFDPGNRRLEESVSVPENTIVGPYASKDDYLERHYMLLREDAVAPLRSVVSEIQTAPYLEEKDSLCSAYLYEKVSESV